MTKNQYLEGPAVTTENISLLPSQKIRYPKNQHYRMFATSPNSRTMSMSNFLLNNLMETLKEYFL